jgi:hypothetical protein
MSRKTAFFAMHKRNSSHAPVIGSFKMPNFLGFPGLIFLTADHSALAYKVRFQHIAAARYRDLRLRGRRPSWAFPP